MAQISIELEKIFLQSLLAKDEKNINYNKLFFEIDDKSVVKSADFLKEIGSLYDLLIYLLCEYSYFLTNSIRFFKAITAFEIVISNIKADITDQSEKQKKKIFEKQENFFCNAKMLFINWGELIDQFTKNNIISKSEKFYDTPKKSEEIISEKLEQKSDQSIPKWVQVPKDLIL